METSQKAARGGIQTNSRAQRAIRAPLLDYSEPVRPHSGAQAPLQRLFRNILLEGLGLHPCRLAVLARLVEAFAAAAG